TGRDRGWGVRSVEPIKAGAFICEYAGELLPESVAEARGKELSDNYLFDLARHGAGKTWKVGAGGAQPPRKKRSTLAGDREVETGSNGETFQCSSSEDDDSVVSICEDVARNSEFTIDAHYFGNVGRFVNHSCSPNLVIQRVLVDTHDYRLPRLALFAETNIDSLVELT
ncbi:Histone-lysine N-methyltransferase ehmt2, partial [Perkinsus olseni]